jgi:hypothetical protein
MARVAFDQGEDVRELDLLEQAVALADRVDAATNAKVTIAMAWWEQRHGDLDEGWQLAQSALAAAEEQGSTSIQIDACSALAALSAERDDLDAAVAYVRAGLALAEECGDLSSEAIMGGNLGVTLHLQGDATGLLDRYRDATGHYERELSLRRALGDRIGASYCLLNLAQARLRLGESEACARAVREGLAEAEAVHARRNVLFAVQVEADRRLSEGDVVGALPLLGVVRAQAWAERNEQSEMDRILGRVDLDPATVEAGLAAGATLDLDQVVADLLASPP